MKQVAVNVPTGGSVAVIVSRKKPFKNKAQQDLFGSYQKRWIADMANFVRSMPKPVAMSAARIEAGKRSMAAPAHQNWYGSSMRAAGLKIVGHQRSPIKSRRGGWEAVWDTK